MAYTYTTVLCVTAGVQFVFVCFRSKHPAVAKFRPASFLFGVANAFLAMYYYNLESGHGSDFDRWFMACMYYSGLAFLNIANLHLSQGIRELEGQHLLWTKRVHVKSGFNIFQAIFWQFFAPFADTDLGWTVFWCATCWYILYISANGMVAHSIRYSTTVRAIPRILLNIAVIVSAIVFTCNYIYISYAGFAWDSYNPYNSFPGWYQYYAWLFWFFSIEASSYNMTPMVCLFWMSLRPAHIEREGDAAVVVTSAQPQTTVVQTQQTMVAPGQQYTYQQQQPGYAPLQGTDGGYQQQQYQAPQQYTQ